MNLMITFQMHSRKLMEIEICVAVCVNVLDRYEDCCKVEGGHIEHLRD